MPNLQRGGNFKARLTKKSENFHPGGKFGENFLYVLLDGLGNEKDVHYTRVYYFAAGIDSRSLSGAEWRPSLVGVVTCTNINAHHACVQKEYLYTRTLSTTICRYHYLWMDT